MSELNLVLLGPPGSGKGTQGERLQEDFRLPYYATGDILRAAVRDGTELGREAAKEYMDRGDLVPDEVIVGVIAERTSSEEAADGFILDGFPRTIAQAEALDAKMEELGPRADRRRPDRRLRRGGRAPARRPPHLRQGRATSSTSSSTRPRTRASATSAAPAWIVRDDDKPEVIRHRLEQYHEKTEPLVAYYEERGLLRRVDGSEITARRGQRPDPGPARHPAHGGGGLLGRMYRGVIIRKTPSRSSRWPPPARSRPAACDAALEVPSRRHHGRARRGGRALHRLAGRRALVQGLPRLPRLDLRLAELDGRPRDPGRVRAASAATSSRSTSG